MNVREKGYKTLVNASKEKGDNVFTLPLADEVLVHESCRKKYTSSKCIISEKKLSYVVSRSFSEENSFSGCILLLFIVI